MQYLMGHSDISVTLDTYTHFKLEDAKEDLERILKAENLKLAKEDVQPEKKKLHKKGEVNAGANTPIYTKPRKRHAEISKINLK